MPQFATNADLATRLGLVLTPAEQTRADALLASASGLIQDEVEQTIAEATDDVLTRPGTTDDRILLPQRPVISVASVTLDGQPLVEGSDWYLDGDAIVRIPTSVTLGLGFLADTEMSFPLGTGFGWERQTLEITYTHGYATIPELCKQIAVEMVVRVWVNPGSVIQETDGGVQTTYAPYAAPPEGLMVTDNELKKLRRRFGRKTVSVRLDGGA